MKDLHSEIVSADELYMTCTERVSTVVVATITAHLDTIAAGFRNRRFTEFAAELSLLQSADRDTSNRVAVSLNLPVGLISPPKVLFDHDAWWVIRLSDELIIAKPVKDDAHAGSVGAEIDAEFYAVIREKGL